MTFQREGVSLFDVIARPALDSCMVKAIRCMHSMSREFRMRRYLFGCCLALCATDAIAATLDCGEADHRQEIRRTERKIRHAEPVESTVGEFPTDEGTPACVRIEFRLSPSGTPWDIDTPESSDSFAFNLAAMRAFSRYRFQGSWWGFLERNVVVIKGLDNKKPPGWHSSPSP